MPLQLDFFIGTQGAALEIPAISSDISVMQLQKIIPPPLTGGGQGVREAATWSLHGNVPPTLALPRQGGGNFFENLQEHQAI